MKHTNFIAFADFLPNLHYDVARADFCHAYANECHETDCRVRSFDEDDYTSCKASEVGLRGRFARLVDCTLRGVTGVADAFEQRPGFVCAFDNKCFQDTGRTTDGN